jgi:hypothetical protein
MLLFVCRTLGSDNVQSSSGQVVEVSLVCQVNLSTCIYMPVSSEGQANNKGQNGKMGIWRCSAVCYAN